MVTRLQSLQGLQREHNRVNPIIVRHDVASLLSRRRFECPEVPEQELSQGQSPSQVLPGSELRPSGEFRFSLGKGSLGVDGLHRLVHLQLHLRRRGPDVRVPPHRSCSARCQGRSS